MASREASPVEPSPTGSVSGSESGRLLAIAELNNLEGNDQCADCGYPKPTWVSETFGVFVCTKCSGVHRQIVHDPTSVISLTTGALPLSTINNMKQKSNASINREFEAKMGSRKKPTHDSSL